MCKIDDLVDMIEKEDILLEVDIRDIDPDKKLVEQGVDSLDVASILFSIENYFGIKIDNESVAAGEWTTVNKILSQINKRVSNR